MTSGNYLKQLVQEKGISVTALTNLLGLKSKNTVYRLFKNQCSKEKTAELISKIAAAVELRPEEIETLNRLSGGEDSYFYIQTRDILMNIYKESLPTGFVIKHKDQTLKFSDLLDDINAAGSKIFINGITDISLIGDLCEFLRHNRDVEIYHIVRLRKHSIMTAYEILAMIELMNFPNYMPYIADSHQTRSVYILSKYQNERRISVIEFINESVLFMDSYASRDLYDYVMMRVTAICKRAQSIKMPGKKVVDYIDIMKECLQFETKELYVSTGAVCFDMLPFDVACNVFRRSGFVGFPEDHPYVKQLIDMYKQRYESFINSAEGKKYLFFDDKHIQNMLQTGLPVFHPEGFVPLNNEEMYEFFNSLIGEAKGSEPKREYRFIDLPPLRNSFAYVVDHIFCMYHSDSGYMDGFEVMIKNEGLFDIMNDFVKYVWNNHTKPDSEAILKSHLNK